MPALLLRFLTGACMVGVYPAGVKIMATWTKADRGLAIGLLMGAIAIGTAFPHFLNPLGVNSDWRVLLYMAAGLGAVGEMLAWMILREGP